VITVERIDDLRTRCDDARRVGKTVGFVPTMGYFHEGHLSLMRAARRAHDLVVVSLFVNPTQFGPGEDLEKYPRDPEGDARAAEDAEVDILFTPSVDEMYPREALTHVQVDSITEGLCGRTRPHHFGGVATVVTKLLSIVGPCTAYFGKKDFQQLAVIRRLVEDLNLPVTVTGCSTVREIDGLAMSSRNAYLDVSQRHAATVLFRALELSLKTVMSGERDPAVIREAAVDLITAEPLARLDYAEVVRADDLSGVERIDSETEHVIALAANVGSTRLIDNATFTVHDDGNVTLDLQGFGRDNRET
jgi:pantoate--beta-alanine ligase